jgi:hypothetical protein
MSSKLLGSEDIKQELDDHNRYLELAGVEDLYFMVNIFGDYEFEVCVVDRSVDLRTWFYNWSEAEKFCVTSRPSANWETTGWV